MPWLVAAGEADFDAATRAPVPVLVDLWAAWCGPCKMVAPVLEELAAAHAGRLKVVKVDVEAHPGVGRRFGASSIPTFLVFRDGEMVERWAGAGPRAAFEERLRPHLGAP